MGPPNTRHTPLNLPDPLHLPPAVRPPPARPPARPPTRAGYGWQAGWLMQDLWQFCFAHESVPGMWLAAACLLMALAAFLLALLRLRGAAEEIRDRDHDLGSGHGLPLGAYVLYAMPTSINAAWLSVATALGEWRAGRGGASPDGTAWRRTGWVQGGAPGHLN